MVAVPSELLELPRPDGTVVSYVVQPVLAPDTLVPEILRAAEPDPEHPVLAGICAALPHVVDDRNGLDGQGANWAVLAGGVVWRAEGLRAAGFFSPTWAFAGPTP